jgi:hypothetical protein
MSDAAAQLQAKVSAVADELTRDTNALLQEERYKDALKRIALGSKELKALKAEVVLHERSIRQDAADARLEVSNKGQTIGAFAGPRTRGALARGRAAEKRSIASQQADAMEPFQRVKFNIDAALAQIDAAKIEIEKASLGILKAADPEPTTELPPPSPAAVPASPPHWASDPTGRHELRYFDGTSWTSHVSDAGVQATDPL